MLTSQQQSIVDAPLESMCVIACAGSGKTETAVARVAKICEELKATRSHVALLSFSNVAVNTFRDKFNAVRPRPGRNRVTIDTFDSFLTSHVVRPHGHRTMKCDLTPFLLAGTEGFLSNPKAQYRYYSEKMKKEFPVPSINDVSVRIEESDYKFYYSKNGSEFAVLNGKLVTKYLGRLGAYTHNLSRLWCLLTLKKQPGILKILACRYSHIIVDEAQDVGSFHQAILNLLIQQGVKVTFIGDPCQAIYEFAGANGSNLKAFDLRGDVISKSLSKNFRSIPKVVTIANKLSDRDDEEYRKSDNPDYSVYYTCYDPEQLEKLKSVFSSKLLKSNIGLDNSAILCRSKTTIQKFNNTPDKLGQGKMEYLARAAVERDNASNFTKSFDLVLDCIVGLLKDAPKDLKTLVSRASNGTEYRYFQKEVWRFVRSAKNGLPSSELKGKEQWHKLAKDRFIKLLNLLSNHYGYDVAEKLGNKLAKTKLPAGPLVGKSTFPADMVSPNIRIDTVHQAKGESLDAVLYVVSEKKHIESMLQGATSEVGRIGYVALTRAKNIFILAMLENHIKSFESRLNNLGFSKL